MRSDIIKYNKNETIKVIVTSIKDFGVFVESDDKTAGLIHISQIGNYYVKDINLMFGIGDELVVKVLNYDEEKQRLNLKFFYKKMKLEETETGFKSLKEKIINWIDKKYIFFIDNN